MTFEDPNIFRPEDHFIIQPERARWSDTPVSEEDSSAGYRQPHLGYSAAVLALLFLVVIGLSVLIAVVAILLHHMPSHPGTAVASMPKASIALEAASFGITFLIAWFVFPRFWRRSFAQVIRWNVSAVKGHVGKLMLTGIALSLVAQALESLLTLPKEMPVDAFFRHPSDVWVIALFGTLVAPVAEEIFFRGFLLRGFAIFFDWLAVSRTEEGRALWRSSQHISTRAHILAGVVSSGLFAAMHAAQLGWAWNAVGVLWLVGAGLTAVRLRFDSVAASAVVHATYNGFLFAVMFVVTDGFRHLDKLTGH